MDKPCAFCDRTQFEERHIYESPGFHQIATLGQITDGGYTLIFPKEQVPCIGALDEKVIHEELDLMVLSAATITLCEYESPVTIVEHGKVAQTIPHAHIHIIPFDIKPSVAIAKDFPNAEVESFYPLSKLATLYQKNPRPYLFWIGHDEGPQVCWNPPAESMYWRIVAAKALGRPERANWRTMDPELDRQLWSETVERFKPYYI
ncbi:MAG: hypothetical protein KGJ89_01545 [Patescibacteria group bacterium]|nr:hypothetical protein [Patescibacteria group bacterium]MDE2015193.1 hypothetical protein [Patescibacteria group bacterium]MDE2226620.1 hypothetical protein [Patescibacteria group bacterium]